MPHCDPLNNPNLPLGADTLFFMIPHGINNRGQVVGQVLYYPPDCSVITYHGFVWLPANAYGQDAGSHSLHAMFDIPSADVSNALAINDAGLIVGELLPKAYFWNLADVEDHGSVLSVFGSIATDVNNNNPPIIVGTRPAPDGDIDEQVGFRHDFLSYEILEAPANTFDFDRRAVVNAVADGSAIAVGNLSPFASVTDCALTTRHSAEAAQWDVTDPDALPVPDICQIPLCCPQWGPLPISGSAADINSSGDVVGHAYDPGFDFWPDRVQRAWFWSGEGATLQLPSLLAVEAMEALALTERYDGTRVQVAGRSITQDSAILWERDSSGAWSVIDLNSGEAGGIFCDDDGTWIRLVAATDINDKGWITGYGLKDNVNGLRGFVLIPQDCPTCPAPNQQCRADFNLDGVVNVSDLLYLFAHWGPVDICASHFADLNNDGHVNVSDMLILFAAWGPCPGTISAPVPTLEESIEQAGLTMAGWDAYVSIMTSGTARQKANWTCWMTNYLSGCSVCPACPGSDVLAPYKLPDNVE